ncbi:MAG: hypothetical protein HYR60_32140 [Acidobacteria bacterium]|nr:hypothetical protein [Acidobacteriota bacterium]MBI3471904.1 hypothetical protein [Candidatus Solibacter usitatus]
MIPDSIQPLFWDIPLETFDPAAYPEYTILRILEFGDENAVAWLRRTFTTLQITQVLRSERRLSRRSANFWALVYGVPVDQVAALRQGG